LVLNRTDGVEFAILGTLIFPTRDGAVNLVPWREAQRGAIIS